MNVLDFWLASSVPLVDETTGKQIKGTEIEELGKQGYEVVRFGPMLDFRIEVQLEKK